MVFPLQAHVAAFVAAFPSLTDKRPIAFEVVDCMMAVVCDTILPTAASTSGKAETGRLLIIFCTFPTLLPRLRAENRDERSDVKVDNKELMVVDTPPTDGIDTDPDPAANPPNVTDPDAPPDPADADTDPAAANI